MTLTQAKVLWTKGFAQGERAYRMAVERGLPDPFQSAGDSCYDVLGDGPQLQGALRGVFACVKRSPWRGVARYQNQLRS